MASEPEMSKDKKIEAARKHVEARLADIIIRNFDDGGQALETIGTFTALLEAHQACVIAQEGMKEEIAKAGMDAWLESMKDF